MAYSTITVLIITLAGTIFTVTAATPVQRTTQQKSVTKREIGLYGDIYSSYAAALSPLAKYASAYSLGSWSNLGKILTPSPSEVAHAIAAAKQASANVMIAQQQVQAAKDHVLSQQKIAIDKESAAALLTQKSETAAAIQRSEAAAAAQGVVLAQQRLAAAKSAVAHQQRIAATKEAEAANALQRAAHAAAAEIQKTENEASKYANQQRTETAAAAHHLAAAKDATIGPITNGYNHVPNLPVVWPAALPPGGSHEPNPWARGATAIPSAALFGSPKAAITLTPFWK